MSMMNQKTSHTISQKITGTVYGVVLNDHASLRKLGSALQEAPYKGAPKAPVMYIKPRNTFTACGGVVHVPAGVQTVEVGATLGLVMGRTSARLTLSNALDAVSGVVLAADLSLPHSSYYRPAIREKCFDGSLPLSTVFPCTQTSSLMPWCATTLTTWINGQAVEQRALTDLVRSPAQLLTDVSEFMTLSAGDVLLLGVCYQSACAQAGSHVRIDAEGLGSLQFSIAEALA